jgi:hypothetical protein
MRAAQFPLTVPVLRTSWCSFPGAVVQELQIAGVNFKAFDLGGHEIARKVWKDYYAKVCRATASSCKRSSCSSGHLLASLINLQQLQRQQQRQRICRGTSSRSSNRFVSKRIRQQQVNTLVGHSRIHVSMRLQTLGCGTLLLQQTHLITILAAVRNDQQL